MAVLLTSGPRTGLAALGGGGWTAAGSYDQINRFLRRTLSPEHALLFAEPSERPGIVDWYTDAPHAQAPMRFVEARPEQREKVRSLLARLVEEITASADSLGTSDRQSDRITGEMLRLALEIPGESSVWIVGEQPVLVFWGHREEVAARTPNPLLGLIARRAAASASAGIPTPISRAQGAAGLAGTGAAPVPVTGLTLRTERLRWLVPGLWAVLALLLLSIGLQLLRGCALGLPASLTGWFVDFCPVREAAAGPDPRLAAERASSEPPSRARRPAAGRCSQTAILRAAPAGARAETGTEVRAKTGTETGGETETAYRRGSGYPDRRESDEAVRLCGRMLDRGREPGLDRRQGKKVSAIMHLP